MLSFCNRYFLVNSIMQDIGLVVLRVYIAVLAFVWVVTASSGSQPQGANSNFTIVNGQIYTPGLAIIDAVSRHPYIP